MRPWFLADIDDDNKMLYNWPLWLNALCVMSEKRPALITVSAYNVVGYINRSGALKTVRRVGGTRRSGGKVTKPSVFLTGDNKMYR